MKEKCTQSTGSESWDAGADAGCITEIPPTDNLGDVVFQYLPFAGMILDSTFSIIVTNKLAERALSPGWRKPGLPFLESISLWQRDAVYAALADAESEPLRIVANFRAGVFSEGEKRIVRVSRLPDDTRLLVFEEFDAIKEGCAVSCRKMHILEAQYQHNPAGILLVNEKLEMLSFNNEFLRMWSIPEYVQQQRNDDESLQAVLSQLKSPEQFLEKVRYLYDKHEEICTDEVELLDGRVFYRHSYPVHSGPVYLGRVWYFLDITALKRAEMAVHVQKRYQEAVFEHINDGIVASDQAGRIILFNRAATEMHGQHIHDVPMEQWASMANLFHPDGVTRLREDELPIVHAFNDNWIKNKEIVVSSPKGTWRTLRVNGQAMFDGNGDKIGAVVSLHDITDLKLIKEELHYLAHHDCLTGLPNRVMFHTILEQCLLKAQRDKQHVGVLFFDMDNFKEINDSFGHDAGDQLLRCLAQGLKSCLRESDILCRWGGDEFLVALPGLTAASDAGIIADKIRSTVQHTIHEANPEYRVSTSVGVAVYPDHGVLADKLIRQADRAMLDVKQKGKNGVRYADN